MSPPVPHTAARTVVVVGAAGGIGSACVAAFLARGDAVLAIDRDGQRLASAAGAPAGAGQLVYTDADAANPNEMAHAMARLRGLPPLRTVVYTAGFLDVAPVEETTPALFHRIFDANVLGAMLTVRETLPFFGEGGGSVVLVSSISARVGFPGLSIYSASKGALEGLVRALAVELAPRSIRVNAVAPTMVVTDMARKELEIRERRGEGTRQDMERQFAAAQPIPRFAQPREIAHLIAMMADDALGLMTGAVLDYDGGLSIRG